MTCRNVVSFFDYFCRMKTESYRCGSAVLITSAAICDETGRKLKSEVTSNKTNHGKTKKILWQLHLGDRKWQV